MATWLVWLGAGWLAVGAVGLPLLLRWRRQAMPRRWLRRWTLATLVAVGMVLLGVLGRRLAELRSPAVELLLPAPILAGQRLGGRVLGEYLASHFDGRRVGVAVSPPGWRDAGEEAMLAGLRQATAGRCELLVVEVEGAAAAGTGMWLAAAAFDAAFGELSETAAIVSLAGLPERLSEMRFWWQEQRPPLLVANAQVLQLRQVVAADRLRAILVRRPWLPGEPEPEAPDQLADWLLITADNVAEIAAKYSNVFVNGD